MGSGPRLEMGWGSHLQRHDEALGHLVGLPRELARGAWLGLRLGLGLGLGLGSGSGLGLKHA